MKKLLFILVLFLALFLTGCKKKMVTITFDTQGGIAIAKLENEVDKFSSGNLPVPTKEGSTFLGWYFDSNFNQTTVGAKSPKDNFTLYAKWQVNSYTIQYHINGGTEVANTSHLYGSEISLPNAPTKEHYTFDGWYHDSSLSVPFLLTTMPSNNLNLYAKWNPNDYTITFDSHGGSVVAPLVAPYDSPITKPQDPTKNGYTFLGWYLDEDTEFTFSKMPAEGAQLFAKWDKIGYTITFIVDKVELDPLTLNEGDSITLPTPTYSGYEFKGWYIDPNHTILFEDTIMLPEDITLYGHWVSEKVIFTVIHYVENPDDDSYSVYQTEELEGFTDETVVAPILSLGWVSENILHSQRVVSGEVKGDGTLVLTRYYHRVRYTVSIDGAGGIDSEGNEDLTFEAKYEQSLTAPIFTRKGYQFTSWNTDFPTKMPSSNIHLYALWEPVTVKYKTEYYQESIDGLTYVLVDTITESSLIDFEIEAVITEYPGFDVFPGHVDSNFNGIASSDLVLKVYYDRNTYSIIFKDEKGNDLYTIVEKFGAPVSKDFNHEKVGFDFLGWFTSIYTEEPYEFTTMPYGGEILYARFKVLEFTISFVSNAEISVDAIKADYNKPIQAPNTPIREGYTFLGWFTEEECINLYQFTFMPAEDLTLYAGWEETD